MIKIPHIDTSDVIVHKLGPSTFTWLQKGCRYSYLLSYTGSKGFGTILPGNKKAILGVIAHKLFEERTKGMVRTEEMFEALWEEKVNEAEREITQKYGLAEFHLADYDLMYSAMDTAMKLKEWSCPSGTSQGTGADHTVIEPEKKIETATLKGSIDKVETEGGRITIVDYKTGKVIDEDTGQVKEGYQTQLNLYAYMYEAETGRSVDKLTIQDVDGNTYDVSKWDRQHLDSVLDEVQKIIDDLNSHNDSTALAFTSESCAFCSAKMICEPYWQSSYRVAADNGNLFEDLDVVVTGVQDDTVEFAGGKIWGISCLTDKPVAGLRYRFRALIRKGDGYDFGTLYCMCSASIIMEVL